MSVSGINNNKNLIYNMNTVTIIGNLGRDPRIGTTKNGKEIMSFSLADNLYVRGEQTTQWWDVVVINPQTIASFKNSLKKGSNVVVTGSAHSEIDTIEGKNYLRNNLTAFNIAYNSNGSGTTATTATNTSSSYAVTANGQPIGEKKPAAAAPIEGALPPPPPVPDASVEDLPF